MAQMSEEEWRKKLTPEQYHVLRGKGTEPPFSGKYLNHDESGVYSCAACGAPLFSSDSKYESNVRGLEGWPSFSDVMDSDAVDLKDDFSFGMHRTEVLCKNCGGHLGHLFEDSSSETNKHYCVNSCTLDFKPDAKEE